MSGFKYPDIFWIKNEHDASLVTGWTALLYKNNNIKLLLDGPETTLSIALVFMGLQKLHHSAVLLGFLCILLEKILSTFVPVFFNVFYYITFTVTEICHILVLKLSIGNEISQNKLLGLPPPMLWLRACVNVYLPWLSFLQSNGGAQECRLLNRKKK